MASLARLCVFFVVCQSLVFGLLESNRQPVKPFHPLTPQVHLHGVASSGRVSPLDLVPSIASDDAQAIALDLAEQALGYDATYKIKNSVQSKNLIQHVYLKQTADDGLEIFNADLNINVFNKRALSIGHSFFSGPTAPVSGSVTSLSALKSLLVLVKANPSGSLIASSATGIDSAHTIAGVKGANGPAQVRAGYLQVENGNVLEPVWDIQLDMDLSWWNAQVSRRTGEVLALYDWVNDMNTFDIYPPGVNDPDDGDRSVVYSPATTASPLGWNSQSSGQIFDVTIGNNVYAQANPSGGRDYLNNPRPNGTSSLDFDFPIDFTLEPDTYVNASTTNLFAWNNYIHDIFYQYGFTEEFGNFQENNFGRGGLGNDGVIAQCQDGAGTNNANFATPPDGQKPRMRMYIWTLSEPSRDGDLDVGIVIHEYAHGISNRLTGGPSNVNCLPAGEAGGMGEGWGDFFATLIRQRSYYVDTDPFVMGSYATNNPKGIRKFPYSTDFSIDPETYGYINGANYTGVHAKGEVWCGILWQAYWNLVNQWGWSPNLYIGEGGNNMILQDVVDGMKIQPCNPNFVDARNAILQADDINWGGKNICLLWQAFAIRGLGVNAVGGVNGSPVKEDFTVPPDCL